MDKSKEQPKRCFCARCFLPIEKDDKVDVDGQNFHKICSTCCICRTIPTSIKMFYGHVFCSDCFKAHVLNRFKGEQPRMYSNNWWMQWAPGMQNQGMYQMQLRPQLEPQAQAAPQIRDHREGCKCSAHSQEQAAQEKAKKEVKEVIEVKDKEMEKDQIKNEANPMAPPQEAPKKCICARCLQAMDEATKMEIGGQCFHPQCCRCCFCRNIPKDNVKIYYGQVFCEDCFNRFVLAGNKDTPAENLRACFEQWQNSQYASTMRNFMGSKENGENVPPVFVNQFVNQGPNPSFYRCGPGQQAREWFQANEPRKSATPATLSIGEESFSTWDLSFENRDEVSDHHESCRESANHENYTVDAAEKIEKLTKYLQVNSDSAKSLKKWKNFIEYDMDSEIDPYTNPLYGWVNLQDPKVHKSNVCPDCLWQCGSIFVNSEYFQKEVACCGEYLSFE